MVKPIIANKNIKERNKVNKMTDFEKIKRALIEGGYVENKHFEVNEWAESKNIALDFFDDLVRVEFEFDSKGNLLFIS